jgi:hypothetical protein
VTSTERRLLWIVIGMVAAFIGIFVLVAYIPAEKLRWLSGD